MQFKNSLVVYITKIDRLVNHIPWSPLTDAFNSVDNPSPETVQPPSQQSIQFTIIAFEDSFVINID